MPLRLFDTLQLRRVRHAYTTVSGRAHPEVPGFAGMVEEMRAGLANLGEVERARADDAVFQAMFFGAPGIGLLEAAARRWPAATAGLAARAAPFALRWLVGEVRVDGTARNHLPACAFRKAGGEELCEHVCRRPTEGFLARQGLPITLTPGADGVSCTWRWGAP